MDGSRAAERVIGSQRDIEFSDILFTTNAHVPIPLPFFRNANLRYIIDQAATLPTTKSNPLPGETKGQFILNISDMIKGARGCRSFGEEFSLDFGEWSEAAQNCFRFHQMQDKDGDMGPYATWWSSHFNFFNSQEDKISQYNAWKELELKLRREYRTEPTKFDINHYAMKYEAAKTTYELKLLIEKQNLPPALPFVPRDGPSRGGGLFRTSLRGGKPASDHYQPFLQGSRQRPTLPVCCILCGELDHSVSKHYNDGITTSKFIDGKNTWAKISTSGKNILSHRSPVTYVVKNIHFCVINHERALKRSPYLYRALKKISIGLIGMAACSQVTCRHHVTLFCIYSLCHCLFCSIKSIEVFTSYRFKSRYRK